MEKVLFKIRYLGLGGIERLTIDILNNIKLKDKKIVLMLKERNNFFKEQLPKDIEIIYEKSEKVENLLKYVEGKSQKNIFYKITRNFLRKYYRYKRIRDVNKYIKENKIKTFIDYAGLSLDHISKIKVKNKIYWSHGPLEEKNPIKRKKILEKLENYNWIISICREMEEEIRENFKELSLKLKTIYNFIDEKKIECRLDEDKKLQEKLSKENYCISVGRIDVPKDYETTIKAFKILKERGIKEKLYIIGDGEQKEKLYELIKKENLEKQVFLLGAKSNPYIYIKYAKLFLHSSKSEGFPIVFLETMYVGTAIISSRFKTGAYELIEKEKNGELFEIGNCKEFANKIEKLLINEELRRKYSEKSKKFVEKFYIEKIMKEYEELIENL